MQDFHSNKSSLSDSDDNYRRGLDEVLAGLKAAMLESKKDGKCRNNDSPVDQENGCQTELQPEPQGQVQQGTNDVQMIETVSKPCPQPMPKPMPEHNTNSTQNGYESSDMVHERDTKPYTKPYTNGTPNRTQMVHERDTKPYTNGRQMGDKRDTEPYTKGTQKGHQTVHRSQDFSSLSIPQRNLLKALYNNAHLNGNRTTQKLSLSYVAEMARIPMNSIKNTIYRLKNRGLLMAKEYKNGRNGWVVYEISKDVFFEMFNYCNGTQTVSKPHTKPYTEPHTDPLYNNTNSINTIITTSANQTSQTTLPTDWQAIDITPLADIGLSKKHIAALYEANNITADIVQESINHYAWGLKNNPEPYKKYKNHLCGLMGVLQKGRPWTESGYESEIDILAKEMESRERKQKERREKQMNDLVDLMFPDWENELTSEQKKKIVPSPGGGIRLESEVVSMLLKNYFKKEVLLPRIRKEAQSQTSRL